MIYLNLKQLIFIGAWGSCAFGGWSKARHHRNLQVKNSEREEGEKDCSLNLKHTQAASTYIFGFNGQARAATESEESVNWI